MPNAYADLADLKYRLGDITDQDDDATLLRAIEAASAEIDGITHRTFVQVTETRTFTAASGRLIGIDDLTALTTLATDDDYDGTYGTIWGIGDYRLAPYNAASYGRPYTQIELTSAADVSFSWYPAMVQVTGTWGYGAVVPIDVQEACLLMATRLYQRKNAPYGIAGTTDLGQVQLIPRNDPDVRQLLAPYIRAEVVL